VEHLHLQTDSRTQSHQTSRDQKREPKMNPPDSKPSMNPNPNLKFYDLGCGFIAGTGTRETGNL